MQTAGPRRAGAIAQVPRPRRAGAIAKMPNPPRAGAIASRRSPVIRKRLTCYFIVLFYYRLVAMLFHFELPAQRRGGARSARAGARAPRCLHRLCVTDQAEGEISAWVPMVPIRSVRRAGERPANVRALATRRQAVGQGEIMASKPSPSPQDGGRFCRKEEEGRRPWSESRKRKWKRDGDGGWSGRRRSSGRLRRHHVGNSREKF